ERNPLLERASEGIEPTVAGEAAPERAEFSDSDAAVGVYYGEDSGSNPSEIMNGAADSFEPAQEEWMNRDLGSRAAIAQTVDKRLDNVFSEEPADAAARKAQDDAAPAYA